MSNPNTYRLAKARQEQLLREAQPGAVEISVRLAIQRLARRRRQKAGRSLPTSQEGATDWVKQTREAKTSI
jgi:hypothetical protein